MIEPTVTYRDTVESSIQVTWHIDDLFAEDQRVRFDRPHLAEELAGTAALDFLSAADRLTLNHIRGNAYMNLFAFVEEYIIAQTIIHAQAEMFGDHDAIRALLRFGEEEVKHQTLFKRYCAAFERDFGVKCHVLESAAQVANIILSKSPMGVMLVTLHLELMTQFHYTECMRDDENLDPVFVNILKHHWLEESQHARIDILELDKMARQSTPATIERAVDEYFDVLAAFDALLMEQVDMDFETLRARTGVEISAADRARMRAQQHRSYRKDFLIMGMQGRQFVKTITALSPTAAERLDAAIRAYGGQ